MLGSPSGSGVPTQRGLWPLGAVQAPGIATFSNDGLNKYGVYSLFPGGPSFGSTLYSHSSTSSTTGRFATGQYQQPSDNIFHTSYKVSDSLFSTTSYTFGAPTPPPGSPYSPIPVGQLELLAKGLNTNLLQPVDATLSLQQSPKKLQDKHCDKCCNFKSQICNCQVITQDHLKYMDPINCCTRTNTLKWNEINLKKEPIGQISELSTNSASMIKLEVMSPTQQNQEILGNNIIGLAAPMSQVPVEPLVPVPVPVPPVGLQVVRDPNTGGLLLLSTNGLDSLQQAVVWSGYPQHQPMLLPSLPPVPSPSFQIVPSAPSHCFSGTTFHQQTQAHSTRLVALTTDNKRKIPLQIPTTTLIKIETDQAKTLQPVSSTATSTATVITDVTPLITTHVIYQHPTNFIMSQNTATEPAVTQTSCKSQATSPVTCLTPPPEFHVKEMKTSAVQDASNQTDSIICAEENSSMISAGTEVLEKIPVVQEEEPEIEVKPVIIEKETQVEEPLPEPEPSEVEPKESPKHVLTGLELLSNSIDQFESAQQSTEIIPEDNDTPKSTTTLDGLDLLCALAEQRILEENEKPSQECDVPKKRKKEKRKSRRHSSEEPKRKKMKSGKHYHHEKKKHKKLKGSKERECPCKNSYELYESPVSDETKTSVSDENVDVLHKVEETWTNNFSPEKETDVNLNLNIKIPKVCDLSETIEEPLKAEPKKLKFLKKHFRSKSADFDRSMISSPIFDQPPKLNNNFLKLLKPSIGETPKLDFKHQINQTDFDSSPEKHSASKKRKVGRPRKLMPFSKDQGAATETIVAKKPKNSLIGYFIAAKEKFRLQHKSYDDGTLPSYEEEPVMVLKHKKSKKKSKLCSDLKTSKIKPKLKAEATFKPVEDRESGQEDEGVEDSIVSDTVIVNNKNVMNNVACDEEKDARTEDDKICVLTAELLTVDKLRVLTAMGGLFYAGQLNAIEPPDVYSIVLDGERGNRPHIMSREEILRDAIVEVSPKSSADLSVGTRVCAYWSQQYRCLYPGSIAEPTSPDPELDNKFVLVEFDDGDSGRIDLKDIRLLPSDYPVIEYDLNPLLSLTKRKKKPSKNTTSKENVQEETKAIIEPLIETNVENPIDNDMDKLNKLKQQKHLEKKLLKKKKREKLLNKLMPEKKKRKKHKCYDKKCKDRKHHKKHRKHKKHHDKERLKGVANSVVIDNSIMPFVQLPAAKEEVFTEEEEEDREGAEDKQTSIVDVNKAVVVFNEVEVSSKKKSNKLRDRQESCESRSKMSAFLPARQLWGWAGKEYKRSKVKGRFRKFFYKSIQRGKEIITVGDSAVFLSTGRPDRPYIGKIEAMWELCGTMIVKVKWFYHPEETVGCPQNLQYPGALFESPHVDENDVQTISHKCEVVPLKQYTDRIGDDPQKYAAIYDNNDIYYLAGYYDPTSHSMKIEPGIPFTKTN
uniref:Protein winged eye isoform X1 n=1 Tax=Diabrotica virgifera virgifera TaxID=50390 RepID=A0A6P7FNX5_DIAVI